MEAHLYDDDVLMAGIAKAQLLREYPFTGMSETIVGIPVRSLTPYLYLNLVWSSSPVLLDLDYIRIGDAHNFIWLLSRWNSHTGSITNRIKRFLFGKYLDRKVKDLVSCKKEIKEYLDDTFLDQIRDTVANDTYDPPYVCQMAHIRYVMKKFFGCRDIYSINGLTYSEWMHTPLRIIYQDIKQLKKEFNPDFKPVIHDRLYAEALIQRWNRDNPEIKVEF